MCAEMRYVKLKIGVIYKDRPQLLAGRLPPAWTGGLSSSRRTHPSRSGRAALDFSRLFPQDESGKIASAAGFPSLKRLAISNPGQIRVMSGRGAMGAGGHAPDEHDFRGAFWSVFRGRAGLRENASTQSKSDDLETFLEAFIGMVESAWTAAERHPAMNLLLDKIRERFGTEECILYLGNESGHGLQRAYETGNIRDIDLFEHQANSSIIERVLKTGSPFLENDYWFQISPAAHRESHTLVLSMPLSQRGGTIRVIELLNKSAAPSRRMM
jgi:hypothetical protein